MDKIVYTDEVPKDDLFQMLNNLLSKYIRELNSREDKRVDDSK